MPPIKKYRTIFHYNNHFFLPVKLYSNFNFYDFELKINNKNSCKSIDGSLTKIHFHDQLNISLQFFDIFRERKREKLSKKIRNIRKYIKLTWRDRGWNNFPPFFVMGREPFARHSRNSKKIHRDLRNGGGWNGAWHYSPSPRAFLPANSSQELMHFN